MNTRTIDFFHFVVYMQRCFTLSHESNAHMLVSATQSLQFTCITVLQRAQSFICDPSQSNGDMCRIGWHVVSQQLPLLCRWVATPDKSSHRRLQLSGDLSGSQVSNECGHQIADHCLWRCLRDGTCRFLAMPHKQWWIVIPMTQLHKACPYPLHCRHGNP